MGWKGGKGDRGAPECRVPTFTPLGAFAMSIGMEERDIHGQAPQYLVDCCTPVTDLATRRHLRSASLCHRRHLLAVHVIGSTLTTVGRSRSLSRSLQRPGIHHRTVCGIRH